MPLCARRADHSFLAVVGAKGFEIPFARSLQKPDCPQWESSPPFVGVLRSTAPDFFLLRGIPSQKGAPLMLSRTAFLDLQLLRHASSHEIDTDVIGQERFDGDVARICKGSRYPRRGCRPSR